MATFTALTVGDITETQVVCYTSTQVAVHTLYHKVLVLAGAPVCTTKDLAKAMDDALAPLLKLVLSPAATYYGVQSRVFFPVNSDRWAVSLLHTGVGTVGTDPLPSQTTGLLKLEGDVLGKAGSGRWYLPFPPATYNDSAGSPLVAYLNAGDNIGTFITTDLALTSTPAGGTGTLRSCLVNRTTKVTNFITSARTLDAWATQRRRGAFGRLNTRPF